MASPEAAYARAMAVSIRRAYAIEVDGEIVGFVRGPQRWDAYLIESGLLAVGLPTRASAAERVAQAALPT